MFGLVLAVFGLYLTITKQIEFVDKNHIAQVSCELWRSVFLNKWVVVVDTKLRDLLGLIPNQAEEYSSQIVLVTCPYNMGRFKY